MGSNLVFDFNVFLTCYDLKSRLFRENEILPIQELKAWGLWHVCIASHFF